jgi:hypothetical protein
VLLLTDLDDSEIDVAAQYLKIQLKIEIPPGSRFEVAMRQPRIDPAHARHG